MPWPVRIPPEKRIKGFFDKKLKSELPGILVWTVEGCRAWQKLGGLGEPPEVLEATENYRYESDVVGRFLNEECSLKNGAKVEKGETHGRFMEWCEENGEEGLSRRAFYQSMNERFQTHRGDAGTRSWLGLKLLPKNAQNPSEEKGASPGSDTQNPVSTSIHAPSVDFRASKKVTLGDGLNGTCSIAKNLSSKGIVSKPASPSVTCVTSSSGPKTNENSHPKCAVGRFNGWSYFASEAGNLWLVEKTRGAETEFVGMAESYEDAVEAARRDGQAKE